MVPRSRIKKYRVDIAKDEKEHGLCREFALDIVFIMNDFLEEDQLSLPLLSTEEADDSSKNESAQRLYKNTARFVFLIWSLAAVVVLVLLTLDDAWGDILANTRDVFQDIRNNIHTSQLKDEPVADFYRNGFKKPSLVSRLDESNWDSFHKENKAVFVYMYDDYSAPLSMSKIRVWETVAAESQTRRLPVGLASVDCANSGDLCGQEALTMFPTLRWYEGGKLIRSLNGNNDPKSVEAIMRFIQETLTGPRGYGVVTSGEFLMEEPSKASNSNKTDDALILEHAGSNSPMLENYDNALALNNEADNLMGKSFEDWLMQHPLAFVDFYAPWCVWCQHLAPTWEKFANEVKRIELPVGVGKVDCVAEAELCRSQRVLQFPTLRWFHDGEAVLPDYKMGRTVNALMAYTRRKLEMISSFQSLNEFDGHASSEEVELKEEKERASVGVLPVSTSAYLQGKKAREETKLDTPKAWGSTSQYLDANQKELSSLSAQAGGRNKPLTFRPDMESNMLPPPEQAPTLEVIDQEPSEDILHSDDGDDVFEADDQDETFEVEDTVTARQTTEEMEPISFYSIDINSKNWNDIFATSPDAFLFFGVPWCQFSVRGQIVWEAFAEEAQAVNLPVAVARVDCTTNVELCWQERIYSYPTMRWYKNGVAAYPYTCEMDPDCEDVTTVQNLLDHAKTMLWDENEQESVLAV